MSRTTLTRATALRATLRERKCVICSAKFKQARAMQSVCSPACAAVHGRRESEKAERKADLARKKELQPPKWWKAKAKEALHAYIRARDEGKECASCDTILLKLGRVGGDYDAGHFRSVGSAKHLEFEEKNIFGQCKHCNHHEKGNHLEYERRLRLKMGDEYVDALLADNAPRHYKVADYAQIIATYKAKLKALRALG